MARLLSVLTLVLLSSSPALAQHRWGRSPWVGKNGAFVKDGPNSHTYVEFGRKSGRNVTVVPPAPPDRGGFRRTVETPHSGGGSAVIVNPYYKKSK